MRIFSTSLVFKNEKARALHRLSLVLAERGEHERSTKAREDATVLYRQLYPERGKSVSELGRVDFDEAVVFWSR
jgi:hypothetical protein